MQHTTRRLAELVRVPFEDVTFVGAGINHQSFILRFERDGENLYPLLDDAIARDPELARTVRVELYRRLGYFPTESSEHSAEYVPWFMRHDEMVERFRILVGDYVQRSEENLIEYERIRASLAAGEGDLVGAAKRIACVSFAFNLDDFFRKILVQDDGVLRYAVFDKNPGKKFEDDIYRVRNTVIAPGAKLEKGDMENFLGEKLTGFNKNLYIHDKFILVDPLGKDPIVITGTAN